MHLTATWRATPRARAFFPWLLAAYDAAENGRGTLWATDSAAERSADALENNETPRDAGLSEGRAREDSNL